MDYLRFVRLCVARARERTGECVAPRCRGPETHAPGSRHSPLLVHVPRAPGLRAAVSELRAPTPSGLVSRVSRDLVSRESCCVLCGARAVRGAARARPHRTPIEKRRNVALAFAVRFCVPLIALHATLERKTHAIIIGHATSHVRARTAPPLHRTPPSSSPSPHTHVKLERRGSRRRAAKLCRRPSCDVARADIVGS